MSISGNACRLALGIAVAAAISAVPATANAGFFDQLFGGGGGGGAPAPSYGPPPSNDGLGGTDPLGNPIAPRKRASVPHKKRTIVDKDGISPRQKTTDLMHDRTLRPGDAVMTKDGMRIYVGSGAGEHSSRQFVSVARAPVVSPERKIALAAVDPTKSDPLRKGVTPDTIASGRSAAVGTPISKGFKITDARGASIRYVGP